MSKNTNLSFLTDYITADITNGRIGINNASPTVAFDVVGATKITGALTLTSTISNGTYTYTLPSATGTLALTSAISGTTNYVAKFTSSSAIGNSLIYDDGTTAFIGATSGGYNSPKLLINNGGGVSIGLQVIGDAGGRISRFQTSDFNNTNTGSSLRMGFGASSGNTFSTINAYSNGESLLNSLVLNSALTITSAGNVGIGTSSPSFKLHIAGTAANNIFGMIDTTGYVIHQLGNTGGGFYFGLDSSIGGAFGNGAYTRHLYSNGAYPIVISTNDVERMRITSGGVLFVGCTTQPGAGAATTGACLGDAGYIIGQRNGATVGFFGRGTDNGELFAFFRGTTQVGNISVTTSATAYNTGSDYRLKEDLKEIKGLEKVSAIKVYDFKWKNEESRMDGVIAHELQEVLPYAVYGEKDGKEMQGVDYSKIVPVLVKAIQELSTEINLLKQK